MRKTHIQIHLSISQYVAHILYHHIRVLLVDFFFPLISKSYIFQVCTLDFNRHYCMILLRHAIFPYTSEVNTVVLCQHVQRYTHRICCLLCIQNPSPQQTKHCHTHGGGGEREQKLQSTSMLYHNRIQQSTNVIKSMSHWNFCTAITIHHCNIYLSLIS